MPPWLGAPLPCRQYQRSHDAQWARSWSAFALQARGGGLFDVGDVLIEPFRNHVQQLRPDVQLDQPAGTGLDGAMLLARQVAAGQVIAREPYLQVFTSTRQA